MWGKVCLFATIIGGLILLFSCNNDIKICEEPTVVQSGISFYHITDSTVETDTILPDATITGVGAADIFYKQQAIYSANLFLDQQADSSRFVITPDTATVGDTVTIRYKRQQKFLSPGCGFVTFFTLDTVITTAHHIDSSVIINKSVTNTNAQNIKLYY